MKKRILSAAAALAVMTSMLTPVYAEHIAPFASGGDTAILGFSADEDELLEDDAQKEFTDWYEWDDELKMLTLKNSLPPTGFNNSFCRQLHMNPSNVKILSIAPGTIANSSLSYAFEGMENIHTIGFTNLKTSSVTKMDSMFNKCSGLQIIDLKGIDTSNVTDFMDMFAYCSSLTSIDLSPLDTSAGTLMGGMFCGCSSLASIDLTPLDTSNATDIAGMFYECTSLRSIDLSPLDTSSATNMSLLFGNCFSLTSIDLSPLDTSNATNISSMFFGCTGIETLDLSPLDTSKVTDMSYMFYGMDRLKELDASVLDTSSVTNMSCMFAYDPSLTSLNADMDTSKVTRMDLMFYECTALPSLDLSKFDTRQLRTSDSMFMNCSSLKSLDFSNLSTSRLGMNYLNMYKGCDSLVSLKLPDTFIATSMALPNKDSNFRGWAKAGTSDIISGEDAYAYFSTTTGEYVRLSNHNYGTPEYTWADDLSTCTASAKCTDCDDVLTETVTTTSSIETAATCNKMGVTKYTAPFSGIFTIQTKLVDDIPYAGHSFGEPVWIWSDDLTSARAVFSCTLCGEEESSDAYISEAVTAGPTETADGTKVITATVVHDKIIWTDKKTVKIPKKASSPKIIKIEPGYGKMNISWESVKGATSYKVYYKSGSITGYTARTGTGALISGIANGSYDVWVTAFVDGKETTQKNIKSTVLKDYYVPCRTTAGMIAGGIKIDWDAYSGASKYRVVCIDKSNTVIGTAVTTGLTHQWKGLKNNQEYGFYVQPFIDGVYPTFSRTDSDDKQHIQWTIPVNSPMITKLSLGNQKIWIYYESVPRATRYYIYKSADGKDTLMGTTTATKFLATGLTNGKAATFYVKALVDGKLTPLKRPATRITRAGMKPALTVTSGQCALKWSKYSDSKASATKYKVVFVDANYKTIDYREAANLSFTWKDKRLVKGRKYGFYVVPYVNGEYIPFGLSYAEDKANVVMFTAK